MKNFSWVSALLLCNLSWLPVSTSESQTVEAQPGEEVTLKCPNISKVMTHTFWSRLDNVNRNKISCIASMIGSAGDAAFCHGFQDGKFHMSSNVSFVFLKIKRVDVSDSGLYLCGFHANARTMIDVIHVKVGEGKEPPGGADLAPYRDVDGQRKEQCFSLVTKLACLTVTALTAVLVMIIIGLLVKILMLQTAHKEEHSRQEQNPGSVDVIYAGVRFPPKARRNSGSADTCRAHCQQVDSGKQTITWS